MAPGQPQQQPDMPAFPISALGMGAIQMHEQKTAFVEAGFTDAEAMQMICAMLGAGVQAHVIIGGLGDR
ncbi:hypothetical protein ACGFI9_21900 [Micromonospora sp. NPDC048930]|uniref:hypothetical protein n=1 Tax=Micromonospora sp. NPDC048930 TaxID=3364261 RepID=UPI003721C892